MRRLPLPSASSCFAIPFLKLARTRKFLRGPCTPMARPRCSWVSHVAQRALNTIPFGLLRRGSGPLDLFGGVSPNKPWPLHRASMEPFGPQGCPGNRHGGHCCPIEFHGPSSGAPNNLAGGPRVVDVPTETARVGPLICARSGPQEPPGEGPLKWDH